MRTVTWTTVGLVAASVLLCGSDELLAQSGTAVSPADPVERDATDTRVRGTAPGDARVGTPGSAPSPAMQGTGTAGTGGTGTGTTGTAGTGGGGGAGTGTAGAGTAGTVGTGGSGGGTAAATTGAGGTAGDTGAGSAGLQRTVLQLQADMARMSQELAQVRAQLAELNSAMGVGGSGAGVGGSGQAGEQANAQGTAARGNPAQGTADRSTVGRGSAAGGTQEPGEAVVNAIYTGTVRSVSATRLVLLDEQGEPFAVELGKRTRVLRNGKSISARQLEKGTRVRATVDLLSGNNQAMEIVALPAPR